MENPLYEFYSNWASIANPVKDVGVCMHAAALAVAVCLLSAPFFHVFVYDLAVNAALSWLRLLQPTHTRSEPLWSNKEAGTVLIGTVIKSAPASRTSAYGANNDLPAHNTRNACKVYMGVNLLSSWQQKRQTLEKRKKAKECTLFTFTALFLTQIEQHQNLNKYQHLKPLLPVCPRSNTENQILKAGFTSREIIILENDNPGGVFEFSPSSRGPWLINVSPNLTAFLQIR